MACNNGTLTFGICNCDAGYIFDSTLSNCVPIGTGINPDSTPINTVSGSGRKWWQDAITQNAGSVIDTIGDFFGGGNNDNSNPDPSLPPIIIQPQTPTDDGNKMPWWGWVLIVISALAALAVFLRPKIK